MEGADRDRLMRAPRPRRDLPLVKNDRVHLPLAPARDSDRSVRPVYVVWEITLACDLACRHRGSRAGHARPDELTTAECLDLVDQIADLGVMEVILIGGEAYLRDDWCTIIARIVRPPHDRHLTLFARSVAFENEHDAPSISIARSPLRSPAASAMDDGTTHDTSRAPRANGFAASSIPRNARRGSVISSRIQSRI